MSSGTHHPTLRIKQMYEEFERLQDIIKVLRKEREEQTTTQNSELAARVTAISFRIAISLKKSRD